MTTPMTTPLPVLVTAIGGGGHGDQILKALRLAKPGRYRIFGADANPRCPQFALVEKGFVLPRASDPTYVDRLISLCRELGVVAVFHGCEPELLVMSRHRERFEAEGILLPINPHDVIETCMDKVRTAEALRAAGFEPPRYIRIHRRADLAGIDFFPVVVKPSRGGGGSANCYIAQTHAHLEALGELLDLGDADQHFMVQEYAGTPTEEYTVGVLHDLDGRFINSIAVRRVLESQLNVRVSVPNRTGRRDLGERLVISSGISHGYVGRYPEVTGQCEEIAAALEVRGPINIQCRLVDGRVKVFEINPRFSGTTSLRAMMGYNEPDRLLGVHLLGEPLEERFPYREGLILRHLCETEVVG